MVLAMAVLLLQFPAFSGALNPPQPSPKVNAADNAARTAPDAKEALPGVFSAISSVSNSSKGATATATDLPTAGSNEVLADGSMSGVYLPPPAAFRPKIEPMERSSRLWFVLSAAEHGSAAFDAWSTRKAISQGRYEADPMMRPFANSAAIYGAIQVVPFGLDYVARRMEHSSGWARHIWWVPQSLATASYVFSGSYNAAHTR